MEPQFNWTNFKSYRKFPGTFPYGLSCTAPFVLLLKVLLLCNGDGEFCREFNTGLQVSPL